MADLITVSMTGQNYVARAVSHSCDVFKSKNHAMWSCHTSVVTSIWEIFLVVVSIFAKNKVIWSYLKTKFSLKPFLCWRNKNLKSSLDNVNLYNVFKFTFFTMRENLIFLVFLLFQCDHHCSENDWDFVSSTLIRSRDFPTNKGKIGFFLRGIVCKRDFHRITFPDQISLNYFLLKLNWKNISFRP